MSMGNIRTISEDNWSRIADGIQFRDTPGHGFVVLNAVRMDIVIKQYGDVVECHDNFFLKSSRVSVPLTPLLGMSKMSLPGSKTPSRTEKAHEKPLSSTIRFILSSNSP